MTRGRDEYLYLGNTLTLKPGPYTEIAVSGSDLLFPQALLFRKEKELASWYIVQAKSVITRQLNHFAKEMGTGYTSVRFSDTQSKWGSCTHDNRLQFNWRLIMTPLMVLNYVVIHELAHTLEKNHTQLFWMKVRRLNPSYRQQVRWLKEHGESLVLA